MIGHVRVGRWDEAEGSEKVYLGSLSKLIIHARIGESDAEGAKHGKGRERCSANHPTIDRKVPNPLTPSSS